MLPEGWWLIVTTIGTLMLGVLTEDVVTARNLTEDVVKDGRRPMLGEWGAWSEWGECSRTCDVGITTRLRQCHIPDKYKDRMKGACVGEYKQFQTCKKQVCGPGTKDSRVAQCAEFNSKPIGGRKYKWLPYNYGGNQCKLHCRAKGRQYFAKSPQFVLDGTPCSEKDPYHICVSGKCVAVGCDDVLGSEQRFDKCGVCGGDNSTCHIISGIFTRTRLRHGYNHVTRIPKGACNINVTEMFPSSNYLALRETHGKYVVNGNWIPSRSKEYEASGAVVKYYRPDSNAPSNAVEYIYVKGPISHSMDLMVSVFADTKHDNKTQTPLIKQTDNRGIMYSYTIPMAHHHRNHSHHRRGNSLAKSGLSYKTPPKYIEPEYKSLETNQVEALTSEQRAGYQKDDPARTRRYKLYLDQIRRQREASRRTNEANRNNNPKPGSSRQTRNRNDGRSVVSVSRNHGNIPIDRKSGEEEGVPLALNNQVGVPLKSQYSPAVGGVPLVQRVQSGTNRQHIYSRSGSGGQLARQQQRGHYQYNWYQQTPAPSGGASRSYSGSGQQGAVYNSGTGFHDNSANPRIRLQQKPQPGINYGVQPGQPLQPSPLSRQGSRSQSYINYNHRPVYVPPNYGVQSLQAAQSRRYSYGQKDSFVRDQTYLSGRRNSVSLGTLDTSTEYSWKISGFTECSKSCGGGSQDTLIVCVKVNSQAVVTDDNCDSGVKPSTQSVVCNNVACPPGWETGEWSDCSTTCGRGTKSRTVECRHQVSAAITISVSASKCQGERRPSSRVVCNEEKPCVRWRIGDWGQCSAECGRGQRTREVVCVDAGQNPVPENKCDTVRPPAQEICDMGSCAKTWFFTEWTKQCSSECGEGRRTRKLYCSASPQRCTAIRRPESEKSCTQDIPCGGKWFTGPWSKCSAVCGVGALTRDVVCMKKSGRLLAVVGEENCVVEDKPESSKPCSKEPCQAEWYMTKWTSCSRSCDTGTQTREVKCLDPLQHHSTECSGDSKPKTRQSCNSEPCDRRGRPNGNSNGGCRDTFQNCKVVVQARLCKYDYYKNICCHSCSTHHSHHGHRNHGNT